MVALDSNIFIYNLTQNPDFVKYTDIIFKGMLSGDLEAATSVISLTEILSYPKAELVADQLRDDFLQTPNLNVYDVEVELAQEAAKIRRKYGFRTPDAIQLATAIKSESEVFITNDEGLKRFREVKTMLLTEVT